MNIMNRDQYKDKRNYEQNKNYNPHMGIREFFTGYRGRSKESTESTDTEEELDIKEISKDKQVIIISHRPYDKIFEDFSDNNIVLE